MKIKLTCVAVVLLMAFSAFCVSLTPAIAQGHGRENAANPFEGKLVRIYTDNKKENNGCMLQNASLEEIGGRMMLVGTSADAVAYDNWASGMQIGVAWGTVTMYYLMTPEEYEAQVERYSRKAP
ncbi:hypothetical protein SAMN06265222_118114 [Neorhodopirellula lusitana]|uniref:Uncharacterized protein n=1 Tax=Neorhodopirellula lusitana TaxID=445327 RepID=A0ABY1QP68_9BACT|nr:hypothetical protein [Neorhodopirellula lusitana]SMP75035.1 hypothetical protein SAMN06265222_118114 [Neorhodopirellula lusitana]